MSLPFISKLEKIVSANQSTLVLYISPDVTRIPQYILRYDEPFLPFGKAIIDATAGHVSGYMFDLAAYMALGAVGMIALERTIDYVDQQYITVMDGAFVSNRYDVVMDENSFGLDAITLATSLDGYTPLRPDRAVFIMRDVLADDMPEANNIGFLVGQKLYVADYKLTILDHNFVYQDRRDSFSDTLRHQIEHFKHITH